MDSEILIYQNTEGNIKIDVRLKEETVIISVGYRVKSQQQTQFRIWATQRLKMKKLKLEAS